jgi:hypothetical protein
VYNKAEMEKNTILKKTFINKPAYTAVIISLLALLVFGGCRCTKNKTERDPKAPLISAETALKLSDDALLDEIEYRIFNYFWNEVYPETGIAYDHTHNKIGKVAATGFELAAICIGIERGWLSYDDGYERCLLILNTFWDDPHDPNDAYVEGHYGLYWHFIDGRTGKMAPIDCVAMCDSADFIAGVLIVQEYFKDTEIEELAKKIYDNVEWDKFVDYNEKGQPGLLSFGWVPPETSETYYDIDGLLPFNMSFLTDNSMLIYAMALGSATHPIPLETWHKYTGTYAAGIYGPYEAHMTGALFNREVPYSFIDPRRKRDVNTDYYLDTVNAILADRLFNKKENSYPDWAWGLSDCFGKDSYSHAAPPGYVANDGTIATNAFVCSIVFTPELSITAIRNVLKHYKDNYWGKYGLPSSYNLKNDFISPFYVGIETGPMMCMIENYRTGMIWDLFMQTEVMHRFLERGCFSSVIDDFELPPEAPSYALWKAPKALFSISGAEPQNGKKCLSIDPEIDSIKLSAKLAANDSIRYNYNKYISLWARDLKIKELSIKTGWLFNKPLSPLLVLDSESWNHYYFKLPENIADKELKALIIEADIIGKNPAIDNITCEAELVERLPKKIEFTSALMGPIGKSIKLNWKKSPNKNVRNYIIYTGRKPFNKKEDFREAEKIVVSNPAGESCLISKTILKEDNDLYYFNIRSKDRWGHMSQPSVTRSAKSNPEKYVPLLYDFDDYKGNLAEDIKKSNPAWNINLIETCSNQKTIKALEIEYNKTDNAWEYLALRVDPDLIAAHRYLVLDVKGKASILAKLYIDDDNQQDIEIIETDDDGSHEMVFDMNKASGLKTRLNEVNKILLFIQPGLINMQGKILIKEIYVKN